MSSIALAAAPTKLSEGFKENRGFAPLKAGEKATYEVILSGEPETPLSRDGRPLASRRTITNSVRIGQYLLYDDVLKADVAMAFTKGTKPIEAAGGGLAIVPNVQEVVFTAVSGGRMIVDASNRNLYEFLEFHPLNANSLGGNVVGEPMFRRVVPEKTAKQKVAFQDRIHDATSALRTMDTRDKQYIADKVGLSSALDSDGGDSMLSSALYEYATRFPERILAASRKEGLRVQQLVRDLAAFNLVTFDTDTNTWRTVGTAEALFPPVAQAANANEALQNFFLFNESGKKLAAKYTAAVEELKGKDDKRRNK